MSQPWEGYGSMTASFSGSGQLAFGGISQIFSGRALALAGAGQLSFSNLIEKQNAALNLSGDGRLVLILPGAQYAAMNLGGDGQVAFDAAAATAVPLGLAGDGLLALPVVQQLNAPMALGGAGALSLLTQQQLNAPMALGGAGALAINAQPQYNATLALTGSGALVFVLSPVFDNIGAGTPGGQTTTPSEAHTISARANSSGGLLAVVHGEIAGSTTPTVTCKCGTTAMTLLGQTPVYGTGEVKVIWLFGLLKPPSGAQTVQATSSITGYWGMNSFAYDNVSGFGTVATNTGTAATATLAVASAVGQLAFAAFGNYTGAFSSGSPGTQRYSQGYVAAKQLSWAQQDAPGAATVNFSYADSSASNGWGAIGVSVIP